MSIEWLPLRAGIFQTQKPVASELFWPFTAGLASPGLCTCVWGHKISMYVWIFLCLTIRLNTGGCLICFVICKLRLISPSEEAEITFPPTLKQSGMLTVGV